jgi:glucan phosphoethanolaminetransferase (alkaline phosphatase superfamily)
MNRPVSGPAPHLPSGLLPIRLLSLSVAQLLTLAPALSPSAIYWPLVVLAPSGILMLLGLALACGLLLRALMFLIRIAAGRHEVLGRRIAAGAIVILLLTLQGSTAYYTRFGSYPNATIIRDFLDAPSAFLAYTASDTRLLDTATFLTASLAITILVLANVRSTWAARRPWAAVIWSTMAGFAILVALRVAPIGKQHTFTVSEHSLPAEKYLVALTGMGGSGIESFQPLIPTFEPLPVTIPKARHVLVIMAEALRADRLPAYGYARDTTPYLTAERERWITFRRAYAHGSRTTDSFPVIFNSRYFAAVDRTNRGALGLWNSLRGAHVRTAFLSAGAIEWGGVMAAIAFRSIDEGLIASDLPAANHQLVTPLPFDYAVDDSVPVERYRALMHGEFGHGSSFATLHLVGSHYPFHYSDAGDVFRPNLRDPSPAEDRHDATLSVDYYGGQESIASRRLGAIANSYDNGILHIDRMVRRAVETLEALGVLEDSVVIVTSDHGEALGEHRTLFHGTTLYEEQVHVPLLIRVGARLAPAAAALRARADDVAGLVDLMPTVHQLVTGRASQPQAFEGTSWLGGARKPYELLLFRGIGEVAGIVTRDRKFIFDVTGGRAEEYDLSTDPGESRNLWSGPEGTPELFIDGLRRRRVLERPSDPAGSRASQAGSKFSTTPLMQ